MNRKDTEYLVRELCRQDELVSDIEYTEDEIQKFLNDEHPFIARMISGSIKGQEKETSNEYRRI